jgi:tetratricopeptide (TPR) repeat protein
MNKTLKTKLLIANSVAVVAFIVYLPSLRNEFIWDDHQYISENFFIRSLDAQLLKSAFTGFYGSNWHPLTWLSHAVDYAVWGLNPLGHHLTNNALHALNTLVVVFLVMRLLEAYKKTAGNSRSSEPFLRNRTIAITGVTTGLLFGLHPLHVESVAWVAERKDLLCAFFYLITLMTYTQYVSEINASGSIFSVSLFFNKKYLFATGFFILALLSKPMAVSLPFVLLIVDWYALGRIQSLKAFWGAAVEKLPFLALALISSTLTILAQEAGGAIRSTEAISLASRLIVAAKALVVYLVKVMLPFHLVPLYPYPKNISLLSLEYIIPVVIVIAITATCIAAMKRQKLWMAVWSYYVITLIPVLGIVQVGFQSMADRYTYLPSLGPFLLIGIMAATIYEKVSALKQQRVIAKVTSFLIVTSILVCLSYTTIRQIGIWNNSIVFWNYVIHKEPSRMALPHYDLGNAYLSKGLLDKAIEQYRIALSLKPDYAKAHFNLGNTYWAKGRLEMAIEQYETTLKLRPNYAEGYYNLGNAYSSKGLLDKAIEQYRIALSLKPDYAEAHYNLGLSYLEKGYKDLAQREFAIVLRIRPDDYWTRRMLNSIISK